MRRGAVGGSIDITTKTPQAEMNLMGHDADQPGRTGIYSKRWGVALSIAFGPNGGTPISTSRSRFCGLNGRDYRRGRTDTGEVKVEHRFNGDWKVGNTTMYGRSTLDYIATNPQLIGSGPYAGMLGLQAKSGKYATNSLANQTELSGTFDLAGMRHTLTTGVEFSNERGVYSGYLVSDATGANMRSIGSSGFASCAVAYNCTPVGSWNPNNPWTGSVLLNGDTSFPGPATYTTTNIALTRGRPPMCRRPRTRLSRRPAWATTRRCSVINSARCSSRFPS